MKEILKVIITLAVGIGVLWTFGFIRVGSDLAGSTSEKRLVVTTLVCKGKMVTLPDPNGTNPKSNAESIVQIGPASITVDHFSYPIKYNSDVRVEYSESWEKDGDYSHYEGWIDRTNGNAWMMSMIGRKGNEKPVVWLGWDLKCSKAPERIF